MRKKIISLLCAGTMIASACAGVLACGEKDTREKIVIWVSETKGVTDITKQQVKKFFAQSEVFDEKDYNVIIQGQSESSSATQMITDVASGADIYGFAQDQFSRLVQAGALQRLGVGTTAKIVADNVEDATAAVLLPDEDTGEEFAYAFPMTADNGYFMYYDTRVMGDTDMTDLATIVAKCESEQKQFSMELSTSAWYVASFFFAVDNETNQRLCVSDWETNDKGDVIGRFDTFNSENGMIAMKGMNILGKSAFHNSSSDASVMGASRDTGKKDEDGNAIMAGGSAVLVSGTWAYNDVKTMLTEKVDGEERCYLGIAQLPNFTVDGKTYHMGSYKGYKLLGVKPQTNDTRAELCQSLAAFLTNEQSQLERFDSHNWGPSNKKALEEERVAENDVLTALYAQNEYAVPQGQIHGSWWDIAKLLGTEAEKKSDNPMTATSAQAALDAYDEACNELFAMSDEEKAAWTIIGSLSGGEDIAAENFAKGKAYKAWDTDLLMVEDPKGTWTSVVAVALEEGDAFKIRQGRNWDIQFGGAWGDSEPGNYVVETAGTYYIRLVFSADGSAGKGTTEKATITLVPAEE